MRVTEDDGVNPWNAVSEFPYGILPRNLPRMNLARLRIAVQTRMDNQDDDISSLPVSQNGDEFARRGNNALKLIARIVLGQLPARNTGCGETQNPHPHTGNLLDQVWRKGAHRVGIDPAGIGAEPGKS